MTYWRVGDSGQRTFLLEYLHAWDANISSGGSCGFALSSRLELDQVAGQLFTQCHLHACIGLSVSSICVKV